MKHVKAQWIFLFPLALISLWAHSLSAHAESECFRFTEKSVSLLKSPPADFKNNKDLSDFGTDSKNNDWGSVSGIVEAPIQVLYQKLQDPKTIRNSDNTTVSVSVSEPKNLLKLIVESIVIKPTFFITIEWKEDWAYQLKEGTKEKPALIQISYQKVEGTSHIKHLCGNILLKALTPKSTGVFLYEEVQADRRSAEDVVKGITGTLRTLRE